MNGEKNVRECTFVENNLTKAPFFSTPVVLGPGGVESIESYGPLSDFEKKSLDALVPDLVSQAKKGTDFVK
jgi:malate dehydrogenase